MNTDFVSILTGRWPDISRMIIPVATVLVLLAPGPTVARASAQAKSRAPATDPVCLVEPDSLNFCSGNIGSNQAELPLTITNSGGGVLAGRIFDDAPIFHFRDVPSGYEYALGEGQSETIWVVFDPPASERYYGLIDFEDTGCSDVRCHGYGQYPPDAGEPYCLVQPSFNQFTPPVVVGEELCVGLYIDNVEGGYLTGSLAESCGDFHIQWPCDFMITRQQTWRVCFRPTVSGEHLCVMPTGGLCEVGFSAIAIDPFPSCQVQPDTIDFGPVQVGHTGYGNFRILNTGNEILSGGIPQSCGDFWRGAGGGSYEIEPGRDHAATIHFSPASPGEQTCTMDTGNDLCADLVLIGVGIEPSPDEDVIGIYFEQSGRQNTYTTTTPNELVTAYLMILNPSSPYGVSGWECCVEVSGDADPVWWELPEGSINVDMPPCFAVGMSGLPLTGDAIVVATAHFIQGSPEEATYFYIHPTAQPSLPGVPAYADGFDPGHLIPLDWSSGAEEVPVARVNAPVTDVATVPGLTTLYDSYPNPFNPLTHIRFELARPCRARLEVYDLTGRIVRTLLDGRLAAGPHDRLWDGRDDMARAVPAGVYFYRLQAGTFSMAKKTLLLK
jgi:hypothetical protein